MNPSMLPTVAGDHCLSPEQVVALRKAVDELDAFMVYSVEQMRQNVWHRQEAKDSADFHVRGLLVCTMTTISIYEAHP